MYEKAKIAITKAKKFIFPTKQTLTIQDVQDARKYIQSYWSKIKRYHPKDDETLLGLPKPYFVPAYEGDHPFDFDELYYWDSYFIIQGMLDEKHKAAVMG